MIFTGRVKGVVKVYEGKKERLLGEYHNHFVKNGKHAFVNFLKGGFMVEGYKHIAIGVGRNESTDEMTRLENEQFRKELGTVFIEDETKIICEVYIENNEANFNDSNWYELGLIVGGSAKDKASGSLFNRVLVNERKNEGKAITISWEITIES